MCGEYKLMRLRDCPVNETLCDQPERVFEFWTAHIQTAPWFLDEQECFVVLYVNTRRRVTGFNLVSMGIMDTILVHAREVFRTAIVCGASAVILAHNHPSGDPTPSEADIKVTRDLIRAGQLLKIEVLDHLVIGKATADHTAFKSLRQLGYFYQ